MKIKNALGIVLGLTTLISGVAQAGPLYVWSNVLLTSDDNKCTYIQNRANYINGVKVFFFKHQCGVNNHAMEHSTVYYRLHGNKGGANCSFSGKTWRTGVFAQNWHHSLTAQGGNCVASETGSNNTFYAFVGNLL